MYTKKIIKSTVSLILVSIFFTSCSMESESFDTLSSNNVLKTESDVSAAVTGIYHEFRQGGWDAYNCAWGSLLTQQELCTDEADCNFVVDVQLDYLWKPETEAMGAFYKQFVPAITRTTALLERIKNVSISAPIKRLYIAELRTVRAMFAFDLYDLYGTVPVIIDPDIALNPQKAEALVPVRPTTDWYVNFIETELKESQSNLRTASKIGAADYGHVTTGISQMYLLKLYMHEAGQEMHYRSNEVKAMFWWAKADSVSNVIIQSNQYSLQADYMSIWSPSNQRNKEVIFSIPCFPTGGLGNIFLAETLPADYVSRSGIPLTKWGGFLTPWEFYDTYNATDKRRQALVTSYWNGTKMVDRRTEYVGKSAPFPMKYQENPNTNGNWDGSEYVICRYAEVILSRAEAINERFGPTQEAKDLVHSIRRRAFENYDLSTHKQEIDNITDKVTFRKHILKERGWEFCWEGKRRPDLIRHGKLIEDAQNRGKIFANLKHILYPIPQSVIYESPSIVQNPGYDQ